MPRQEDPTKLSKRELRERIESESETQHCHLNQYLEELRHRELIDSLQRLPENIADIARCAGIVAAYCQAKWVQESEGYTCPTPPPPEILNDPRNK